MPTRTATVIKTFSFDAAHQLPHHEGKCRMLHGHTYRVDVAVAGLIANAHGGPDEGMVIDFDRLKDAWKLVEPILDHRCLNESLMPSVEAGDFPSTNHGGDIVPLTTAENLASFLANHFATALNLPPARIGVTVWETPTSRANAYA